MASRESLDQQLFSFLADRYGELVSLLWVGNYTVQYRKF